MLLTAMPAPTSIFDIGAADCNILLFYCELSREGKVEWSTVEVAGGQTVPLFVWELSVVGRLGGTFKMQYCFSGT